MPSDRRPNVLWIQTDEQRADSVGCYNAAGALGALPVRTPSLDALAARGAVFLDHHVQSPVCVPSRVCELTSSYPHQTGILNNSVHYTWGRWPEGLVSFPEVFAAAGYATANLGKYHTPHHPTWLENWHFEWFPEEADFFSLAEGFDEAEHEIIHRGHRPGDVILSGRYPDIHGGRTPQSYLTDHALDWLRAIPHVRRPFLLRVSFLAPHTPVLAPEPFYRMYDPGAMVWDVPSAAVLASRPRFELGSRNPAVYAAHTPDEYRRMRCTYYGLVSHVDQQVGRLLGCLDDLGLMENTIVAYTADHGDLMGEYGQFQKGMFYDITTRVPCILAGPGVGQGERISRLTEGIDFAPTLLRLAGLSVPATMQGRDLFSASPRGDVIGEICLNRGGRAVRRSWIRTQAWSLDFTSEIDGVPTCSIEERDGKLIDLCADPLGHANCYDADHRAVIDELKARFDARTAQGRRPVQHGAAPVLS